MPYLLSFIVWSNIHYLSLLIRMLFLCEYPQKSLKQLANVSLNDFVAVSVKF